MPKRFLSDAIELPSLSAVPATPPSGRVLLYARAGSVRQKDSAGTETALDAAGGGGGSVDIVTVEANLGSTPRKSGKVTIINPAITTDKQIQITKAPGPYTAKGTRADEAEMDHIMASALAGTGQMVVYWTADSPVKGNVKFNYLVG